MTANVRYPANEVMPHGWYQIVKGDHPLVWLEAYDGSVRFDLMGGLSIADYHDAPESVKIDRNGLTGLIPPWRHIDQKGATEDGVTQIDALIDPNEVGLKVTCRGRDGKHTRQVYRHLIDSIDAKKESTLNFLATDTGEHWWAPVRWFKGAPPDPVIGAQQRRQTAALRLRGDRGLWRTYEHTAEFGFIYDSMTETFTTDYSDDEDLGPNWPQYYTGDGAGYCSTTTTESGLQQARWYETGSDAREVVNGPYRDFDTDTDNQVIEMVLGFMPELSFLGGAFNDLWGRMGRDVDGNWDGNGIRARVGMYGLLGWIELARFNDFTKTVLFDRIMIVPPLYGEKFTLVCGANGDPRMFRVLRNGLPILSHKEVGTNSMLGVDYRGIGFGMAAGETIALGQKSPAWVRKISAGDNANVTQAGFLRRNNIGDQKMYDDYTVFGPFEKIRIWNGPGAGPEEFVEFGPLLANQVALLRADPRDRNVYDLAAMPAAPVTQQERGIFDAALNGLLSFATAGNTNLILGAIQSIFGIFGAGPAPVPPQGNLYSLLRGRFSDDAAIPAKSPGNPVQDYHVKVEIVGGNANSKIIASGIPLRRYPL